jgi:hypothetical protein
MTGGYHLIQFIFIKMLKGTLEMTNNKTPLQKAYDEIIGLSGATYDDTEHANEEYAAVLIRHMSTILEALKAAQAYADLPSKIEGMKSQEIDFEDDEEHAWIYGYNSALDELINLLKEEDKNDK